MYSEKSSYYTDFVSYYAYFVSYHIFYQVIVIHINLSSICQEQLEKFGLKYGPASEIAEFINTIKGDKTASDHVMLFELENEKASLQNENASLRAQLKKHTYG